MNKRQLALMHGSIVCLYPAPFLIEEWRYLTGTHWRVTAVQREGRAVRLTLETLSGALGFVLTLYHDSVKGFEVEDLHYPQGVTQGVLRLTAQWFIPREGKPSFRRFL